MDEARSSSTSTMSIPRANLLDQVLHALVPDGVTLARRPFELRRPPLPPIDPESEAWKSRCHAVQKGAADYGLEIPIPHGMPWSRKAHELFPACAREGLLRSDACGTVPVVL